MKWYCRWGNAFAYYGIVLMTTELFEAGDSCHGGDGSNMAEPPCWLQCKLLTTKDYIDLLWTTISEFPGQWVYQNLSEFPGVTGLSEFPQ